MDSANKDRWCRTVGTTQLVKDWLRSHPQPSDWTGTPEQWAFKQMPPISADSIEHEIHGS